MFRASNTRAATQAPLAQLPKKHHVANFLIHEDKVKEGLSQFSKKSGYQFVGYQLVENRSGYQFGGYQFVGYQFVGYQFVGYQFGGYQ